MNNGKVNGLILLFLISILGCNKISNGVWIIDCKENEETSCGFKDLNGALKIEYGKYPMIFTDTFRRYAIVWKEKLGLIGIDRNEKVLYEVYNYDNGPDIIEEGYFRIVKHDKIGFADSQTGKVKIKPQFSTARPFENGYALICPNCESKKEMEHSVWVNGKWGIIDKKGKVVVAPNYDNIKSIEKNGTALVIENGIEKVIKIKEL